MIAVIKNSVEKMEIIRHSESDPLVLIRCKIAVYVQNVGNTLLKTAS